MEAAAVAAKGMSLAVVSRVVNMVVDAKAVAVSTADLVRGAEAAKASRSLPKAVSDALNGITLSVSLTLHTLTCIYCIMH